MSKRTKTTEPTDPIYLLITEESKDGYYHQYARVVRSRYENGERLPYGMDDRYDGPLYSGLRARCQGDTNSRRSEDRTQAVYGSDVGYQEQYHIDLGDARRMVKMLEGIDRKLTKMGETRGYARGWGQYVGRLAEALGCDGIVIDRGSERQRRTGYRYDWQSIGDGINGVENMIWRWQEAGKPQATDNEAGAA